MKRFLIIIVVFVFKTVIIFSNDIIELEVNTKEIDIIENIYIYKDTTNNLTIDEIIFQNVPFEKNESRILNFGYSLSSYWIKFSLYNNTSKTLNYMLSVNNPDLNYVDFHKVINNNINSVKTGEKRSFDSRNLPYGNYIFKISLKSHKIGDFYIKVNSEGEASYIPLQLHEEKHFLTYNDINNDIKWLVYGLFFFVVIFNIYLYKSIQDKIYLHYALYILFGALFFIVYDGYLAYLNIPKIITSTKIIVPSFFVYFLINFSQIFLETKKKSKKVDNLFNILKISAVFLALFFIFNYPISVIPLIGLPIIASIAYISVIIGSIVLYRKRYLPSLFFLFAFFSALVGLIVLQLKESGVLPANVFYENAFRFGMTIETVLLTLAVLERFRIQQNETKATIESNYKQISSQKKQLEKVNIELEKLSIVASETDNSVAIYDNQYNLEWCNLGFEKLYETSLEEMSRGGNKNLLNFYQDKKEIILESLSKNHPAFFENQTINDAGHEIWSQTTLSPYLDQHGQLLKIIVIESNITKIKEYQEELTVAKNNAEASDRLKSAFLSNMSHEIRTPLNAILGFSELLREVKSDEKKDKYVSLIRSNGQHLLKIISDILDISKIESGQMEVHNTQESINKLLYEMYAFYKLDKIVTSKGLDLEMVSLKGGDMVMTDHSKVRQVLENLMNNAVKFTDKGEIKFGATINDNKLLFFVKDSGIGISDEQKEKIFERFWQSESGLSRRYDGTGLGLSISKGIIDNLDGNIWVVSEPDKGSEFYFEIPYNPVEIDKDDTSADFDSIDLTNKTILIVEDKKDSAILLEEMLNDTGATLMFAENGKDSVEAAINNDVHVILMDLRLPDINGNQAFSLIKDYKPNIPVIAQTANASDNERQRCLNMGFYDYITKPIDRSLLIKSLNSIFSFKKVVN